MVPIEYLWGIHHYHADNSRVAGTRFWFHGLRTVFITVAERDLMLPRSMTNRLVHHARPSDVTEGHAADWTVEQLREPVQTIADRVDTLVQLEVTPSDHAESAEVALALQPGEQPRVALSS